MMRFIPSFDRVLLAAFVIAMAPSIARAQNPFDPPTATKPPPNVMLLMDGTRTTLINGSNCRGVCHVEGASDSDCGARGGEYDCNIYREGETRLQLARRVLTGGWGWDTTYESPRNGAADA